MNVKALLIVVCGLLAAMLVAVVVVAQLPTEQEAWEACLAEAGYPGGSFTSEDTDELDRFLADTEHCAD